MTPGVIPGVVAPGNTTSGVGGSYSRFHAIISATPTSGGLSSLPPRQVPSPYNASETPSDDHVNKKRKTLHDGEGIAKALKNANKNESAASRQRPHKYSSKEALFSALRLAFKQDVHVDFHGSFDEKLPESTNVPHKTRVQNLTADIWKATGYRFTVKDHPRISNGHKTRFWCSQDEAHRSKSSKLARLPESASKPRISSAGEALAKTRFACRSRLLISSRDADSSSSAKGVRTITVRMHHHIAHEPYVDNNLPPEIAQTIYANFGWSSVEGVPIAPLPSSHPDSGTDVVGFMREEDEDGEGDVDGENDGEAGGEGGRDNVGDKQVEDDVDAEAEDESQLQPFEPTPVSMNISTDSRHHTGYGHNQGTSYQHNAQLPAQPMVAAITNMNTAISSSAVPAPRPMTGPSLSTSSIATTSSSSNSHHGSAPATFVDLRQVSPSNQIHRQQHAQAHRQQTTQVVVPVQTIPTPPLSAGSSSGSHHSHGHGGHHTQQQAHTSSHYQQQQAHTPSTNQYHHNNTPRHHTHTQHTHHHHSPHLPQPHSHHPHHSPHSQHPQHHHRQQQQQRQVHTGSSGTNRSALNTSQSANINQRLPAAAHIQPYGGPHHPSILPTPASHHASLPAYSSLNINTSTSTGGNTNTTTSPHHSTHSTLPPPPPPSAASTNSTTTAGTNSLPTPLSPLSQHSHHSHSHIHHASSSSSSSSSTQPQPLQSSSTQSSSSTSAAPTVPGTQSTNYHKRMLEHISTIRDFCAGLEYQLQFNDYRMLDQLEKEGEGFLRLARDCLRKEGRGEGVQGGGVERGGRI